MDLSHQSITGREFELNRRGYDPDSVDAHLAEIAAAVQEKEQRLAELQETITSLEAKVRDADESEEALRLTLKAAAHAKEELLAGAREQARATQEEADAHAAKVTAEADDKARSLVDEAEEKARSLVNEAESRSQSLTTEAEAHASALKTGATAQARELAQAALAESELFVQRIEQLREQLGNAEDAMRALSAESNPRLQSAGAVLDAALEQARASAENPELLAAAATPMLQADESPASTEPERTTEFGTDNGPVDDPVAAGGHQESAGADPAAEQGPGFHEAPAGAVGPATTDQVEHVQPAPEQPASVEPGREEAESVAAQSDADDDPVTEPEPSGEPDTGAETNADGEGESAPHLEIVDAPVAESAESTSDISDKVDRLLEELREVT